MQCIMCTFSVFPENAMELPDVQYTTDHTVWNTVSHNNLFYYKNNNRMLGTFGIASNSRFLVV